LVGIILYNIILYYIVNVTFPENQSNYEYNIITCHRIVNTVVFNISLINLNSSLRMG